MVGLDVLEGLFLPKWLYDSILGRFEDVKGVERCDTKGVLPFCSLHQRRHGSDPRG